MALFRTACAYPDQTVAENAEMDRRLGIIRMIEGEIRANYERLASWSGSYALEDGAYRTEMRQIQPRVGDDAARGELLGTTRKGRWWEVRHVVVQFDLDMRKNNLATTYEVVGDAAVTDLASGVTEIWGQVPLRQRHLITVDEWIECIPAEPPGAAPRFQIARGKGINSAVRRGAAESKRFARYSSVIDPRAFFAYSGSMSFADALKSSADWLKAGKSLALRIEEVRSTSHAGYRLVQEYRVRPDDLSEQPTVVETTFNVDAGYNPSRLVERSPSGIATLDRTWRYTHVSGVYIPSHYRLDKYFDDDTQQRELSRDFTLNNCEVNGQIGAASFSLDRLGLVQGDQLRDDLAGSVMRYDNGEVVPVSQYAGDDNTAVTTPSARRPRGVALLIINIGFLALAAVLWAVGRKRRSKRV